MTEQHKLTVDGRTVELAATVHGQKPKASATATSSTASLEQLQKLASKKPLHLPHRPSNLK